MSAEPRGVDTDTGRTTDSVLAIQKHAVRLVRQQLLTSTAADTVLQALERAIVESREDRSVVVGIVDGLLDALERRLLPPDLYAVDEAAGVARFHLAPTLAVLAETGHLATPSLPRVKRVLRHVEEWFPDSGLSGFQKRFTFSTKDRQRGLALHLAMGREFIKRTPPVPFR